MRNQPYWLDKFFLVGGIYVHPLVLNKVRQEVQDIESVALFKIGAERDDVNSIFRLALMYEAGRVRDGQPKEAHDAEAVRLYTLALDKNYVHALYPLACMYAANRVRDGESVIDHLRMAVSLLDTLIAHKDEASQLDVERAKKLVVELLAAKHKLVLRKRDVDGAMLKLPPSDVRDNLHLLMEVGLFCENDKKMATLPASAQGKRKRR